ncbi:rRNA maturation RNase YbeY [Celeribacter baekdonensis]|uniref:Endoribonuclease YbeY n=1 Tax=Celeribacter baekdonensis B30 TaxID=1208323 RepID=K2IM33_9RHOB|nr:rRNA maturation RNase YbeY [Celeribacter baekdonensis]EKE71191.1 hypothetical protein B30_10520 [Celeribacter baekdonensis B30]
MTIDVVYEDPRWQEAGLDDLAEAAEHATLAFLGLDPDLCEVAVLACDDARIAELNAEFREKPTPTNVLSWPSEERATPGARPDMPEPDMPGMEIELGDIAIAYETCAAEAKAGGTPFNDHVTHLLVHGLLHLLGYDHITDEDAAIMEGIETEILATMGIKDPY